MDAAMDLEEDTFAVNDVIKVTDIRLKKPVAQIGGYQYKYSHAAKSTGKCYWRCIKNVTSNCKAVIYTDSIADGSPVTEIKFSHSHIGDSLAAERRIVRNAAHQIASQNLNLYMRVALDLPRTSNSLEAWHRALKNSLPSEHPSIWRFLEVMKEEFVLSMNHSAAVDRNATQRPKYMKISADLQRYQQEFMAGTTSMVHFLTQCSNKIKFGGN